MTTFIRRGSDLDRVPSTIVDGVSGFVDSPEYQALTEFEKRIPGVVCSAFARYIVGAYRTRHEEERASAPAAAIASSHSVLEQLASSPETAVESLVTDEIFEFFERDAGIALKVAADLRPRAKALYDRYLTR